MRDKYIELIKEYIKQKPQDEFALDDLKAEVAKIGATEAEFDEAVRQITETQIQPPVQYDVSLTARSLEKALKIAKLTKFHLEERKKYIAVISLVLILIVSMNIFFQNKNEKIILSLLTYINHSFCNCF